MAGSREHGIETAVTLLRDAKALNQPTTYNSTVHSSLGLTQITENLWLRTGRRAYDDVDAFKMTPHCGLTRRINVRSLHTTNST